MGLEQCQNGASGNPGNKDCPALCCAVNLSMALGMNDADSIVFITHFSDGYSISIPEVAKNLYMVDDLQNLAMYQTKPQPLHHATRNV